MRGYHVSELARHAGLSRSLLDYWERTGLLRPAGPAGTYTGEQASLALVLADAHHLGAPGPVLAQLRARLEGHDPLTWPAAVWVTPDGLVHDEQPDAAAWLLAPLGRGCDQVQLAIAS